MSRLHTPHYMHKFKLIPTYNVECKIYIKERMKYLDIVDIECLWENEHWILRRKDNSLETVISTKTQNALE